MPSVRLFVGLGEGFSPISITSPVYALASYLRSVDEFSGKNMKEQNSELLTRHCQSVVTSFVLSEEYSRLAVVILLQGLRRRTVRDSQR